MEWGGGQSDARREEQRQRLSCKTGTDPAKVLPKAAPTPPVCSQCCPPTTELLPPEPFMCPWSWDQHHQHRGAAAGQLPIPIPCQPHLKGCRTRGCPMQQHLAVGIVPPPRAGRCPPWPGWAPGVATQPALFLF